LVKKFSWPEAMSKKSVPASYLVGFALGKAAIAAGHEDAVLDIGLAASTPGSRVFAALRGMVEAGLNVPHSEEVLPDDDRTNGAHIDDSIAGAMDTTKSSIEGAY
jgi:large subunit ribosomal protein L18